MLRKNTPPAYGESPFDAQTSGHQTSDNGYGIGVAKREVSEEDVVGGGKGLTGPMMVACHWNMLSPVGPALHDDGGSRPRSINS